MIIIDFCLKNSFATTYEYYQSNYIIKIYFQTFLAISALAILATTASSMEKAPLNKEVSLNKNAISFSASRLNLETANSLDFDDNEKDYALDLSIENNSFSLNASDVSRSDSITRSINFGQYDYSATTPVVKF